VKSIGLFKLTRYSDECLSARFDVVVWMGDMNFRIETTIKRFIELL